MKNISKFTILYIFFIVFYTTASAMAASFSADMVTVIDGKTKTDKLYLSGNRYRIETLKEGELIAIIADRDKNIYRVLNIEEKRFFEIDPDDYWVLSEDPIQFSEYLVSEYGFKEEGTEKINGIDCKKQVVKSQNFARWFSSDLKIPLKMVTYEEGKERAVTELKAVKKTNLSADLFEAPKDFKLMEDPKEVLYQKQKREREERRKAEEALPGLTESKSAQAPCYVKIAAGGELRVKVDSDRRAFLEIYNETNEESEFTVLHYFNGKPLESSYPKTGKLEKKGTCSRYDYNDDFAQKARSFLVDELRIQLGKGLVYARINQSGENRKDFYDYGSSQRYVYTDPKRPLTVQITGDNPFGDQTKGIFYLQCESENNSASIPFTVENGKMLTWDYPADKGVNTVAVIISEGDGRAKISLIQQPDPKKETPESSEAKTALQTEYIPKPKVITEFVVTHPYGTGKPLTPGKNLGITVTGLTDDAGGTIILYTDRKKTKQVDEFKFKLKTNQVETFAVAGEKNAGWSSVWVHEGSFKVKLDQSPLAKTAPILEKKEETASVSAEDKKTESSTMILNGEVPLYNGARIIKEKSFGANSKVDLEIQADPEEIIKFYTQAMTAKGWQPGMSMVQGPMGVLQLKKGESQIMLKAMWNGQKSMVNIAVTTQ
ncbi:MAG: DUF4412 domain-containing protein [Desulfobacterales bacterium]|nr:DUF4412 domain-containing protein [Desulfobacterales bacterium]